MKKENVDNIHTNIINIVALNNHIDMNFFFFFYIETQLVTNGALHKRNRITPGCGLNERELYKRF